MITEEDKDTIIRCAKRYNVESVILFGSSTRDDIESNDIDIGVKGIDPRLFQILCRVIQKVTKAS